jgi:hypothetical protein
MTGFYDGGVTTLYIMLSTLCVQVDMSLTKKEFMMAVKLCSDVAVQRGLPNMRLRAAKNFHSKGYIIYERVSYSSLWRDVIRCQWWKPSFHP